MILRTHSRNSDPGDNENSVTPAIGLKSDPAQKTWVPEGMAEYRIFKQITGENIAISHFLKSELEIGCDDIVLDVGGRDGEISYSLQTEDRVHIVDPDPSMAPAPQPAKFWNERIQDVNLNGLTYSAILCCHVLGYLGLQNAQKEVVVSLIERLDPGGTLVLFYNVNDGYMGELLDFSRRIIVNGHYDFFDESILNGIDPKRYTITARDITFDICYDDYEAMARCCWFLFGSLDQDIDSVEKLFLPKLRRDLIAPRFPINQRITLIQRH